MAIIIMPFQQTTELANKGSLWHRRTTQSFHPKSIPGYISGHWWTECLYIKARIRWPTIIAIIIYKRQLGGVVILTFLFIIRHFEIPILCDLKLDSYKSYAKTHAQEIRVVITELEIRRTLGGLILLLILISEALRLGIPLRIQNGEYIIFSD